MHSRNKIKGDPSSTPWELRTTSTCYRQSPAWFGKVKASVHLFYLSPRTQKQICLCALRRGPATSVAILIKRRPNVALFHGLCFLVLQSYLITWCLASFPSVLSENLLKNTIIYDQTDPLSPEHLKAWLFAESLFPVRSINILLLQVVDAPHYIHTQISRFWGPWDRRP